MSLRSRRGLCDSALTPIAMNCHSLSGCLSGNDRTPERTDKSAFSGGQSIGTVLGITSADVWLISDEGYLFFIDLRTGGPYLSQPNVLYFSGTGCTGSVYASNGMNGIGELGVVFRGGTNSPWPVYYTPRGEERTTRSTASYLSNGTCVDSATDQLVYRAFPNDPLVTGVQDSGPTRPLTLGRP